MSSNHASPPPREASLYQSALSHLARYSTTEAGLRRVLVRQVDRWARAQADPEITTLALVAARQAIETVIGRLVQAGAVSDTAYAESRAKSLLRSGQSNRAVQARLIAKGVAPDTARAASLTEPEAELAAALVLARKRRIGPYRATEAIDPAARMKELSVLARAGFSREISQQALETSREAAEGRIFELRR